MITAGPPRAVHAGPPAPAVSSTPTRPRASDSGATSPVREDVLSAGSTLFAERGHYSVAKGDLAAAADIGRAMLFRHFSSKAKILAELTNRALLDTEHLAAELPISTDSRTGIGR